MEIYWYWPFARSEDFAVAHAVPRAGDHLSVHTIDRPGAPAGTYGDAVTIEADLPEVDPERMTGPRWYASRATTYVRRATARRRHITSGRFDVGHLLFFNYFTDGLDPTLRLRRIPIVANVHDVVPHHRRLPGSVERRLLVLQYGLPDRLIVHHHWVKDRLAETFDVDPAIVDVIPLPVPDVGPGHPPAASSPTVLLFGTLRPNKGIDTLLAAADQLRDLPELRFHIAGRGSAVEERRIRDAACRDERIRFEPGWITPERKDAIHRAASLVVLPYSSFASQSAVLHDAYAYRRPVVVTDVGALGDAVREDRTGWVISPGDPTALASAISGALDDRAAYSEAAAAADRIAVERHPSRIGPELRDVYDRLPDRR